MSSLGVSVGTSAGSTSTGPAAVLLSVFGAGSVGF